MRIVSWNIRAGGGARVEAILAALTAWEPDIIALSEFRATPPSAAILAGLAEVGFQHCIATCDARRPAANCLAVASRVPLRRFHAHRRPAEPGRWLAVEVQSSPLLALAAVHIPNENERGARNGDRKFPYMASVLGVARAWRGRHAVVIGDTNSGRPLLDEETPVFGPRYGAWFDSLEALGWRDAFRHMHPERREFTWYSPNGRNGFRLDQAFVSRRLRAHIAGIEHSWGRDATAPGRQDAVSDHAALILDLDIPAASGPVEGSTPQDEGATIAAAPDPARME
jgi:exodeoxyribonuclease-3